MQGTQYKRNFTRGILFKMPIVLGLLLTFILIPNSKKFGMGYLDTDAKNRADIFLSLSTPWYSDGDIMLGMYIDMIVSEDFSMPTGTVSYYYIEENSEPVPISIDVSNDTFYTWTVPKTLYGKTFSIKAYLKEDDNYDPADCIYENVFCPDIPVLTTVSPVVRNGNSYSFIVDLSSSPKKSGYYNFILTPYNKDTFEPYTSEALFDYIWELRDGEESFRESPDTYLGFGDFENKSEIEICADGSGYDEGLYVFQFMYQDNDGFLSNLAVTEPFWTPLALNADDLNAKADNDLYYTGSEQTPSVSLSVITTDESKKAVTEYAINQAVNNNKLSYRFKQVSDGNGTDLIGKEVSATITDAGKYEIYALSTDPDIVIENTCLGTFTVAKGYAPVPDAFPSLCFTASEDLTKYVVKVDISSLTNNEGRNIEYSFYDNVFNNTDSILSEIETDVSVKIRYAATNNTFASDSVSIIAKTPGKSKKPAIFTLKTYADHKDVVINSANSDTVIFYTLNGSVPDITNPDNKAVYNVTVEISKKTVINAVAAQKDMVLSDMTSLTVYFNDEPTPSPDPSPAPTRPPRPSPTPTQAPTPVPINESMFTVKDVVYTGEAVTTTVSGVYKEYILKENTDFTVSYKKKYVNIGTAKVSITGKGDYSGTVEKTFKILPIPVTNDMFRLEKTEFYYTGKQITPEVVFAEGIDKKDFRISYSSNINIRTNNRIPKVTIRALEDSIYQGYVILDFYILPADLSEDSDNKFSFTISDVEYTGKPLEAPIEIYYLEMKLTSNGKFPDYTVKYSNNINAGKGKAVITGKNNFTGTKDLTFTINPKNLESFIVTGLNEEKTYYWYGERIKPEFNVLDNNTEKVLQKSVDYTVRYKKNNSAGEAKIIIRGKKNYKGEIEETFNIIKPVLKYKTKLNNSTRWNSPVRAEVSVKADDTIFSGTTSDAWIKGFSAELSGISNSGISNSGIAYRAHVDYGDSEEWLSNKSNNKILLRDSTKSIDMIKIYLLDDITKFYDIYYKVYVDKFRWLGWAKNGEITGTSGYNYKIKAIKIQLVPKDEEFDRGSKKILYSKST